MSRIDEALRKSEKLAADRNAGNQDAFVSAWTLDATPTNAHPAPASAHPASASAHPAPASPHPAPPIPHPAPPSPHHTTIGPRAEANRSGHGAEQLSGRSQPVRLSGAYREQLANTPEANQVLVEQFRKLAATLHHAQAGSGIRVVMLTSASADDGKTLTALNLALVLSESYRRKVLLIDADLRRPSLANIADMTDAPGLSEALRSPTDKKPGILQVTPLLTLLPAGRPDPDPIGGLTSARMRSILDDAAARFDWVILDAPPMGPMADANLLASMVDGAVFVVRSGRTHYQAAQRAIETLGRERILGVVLNGVEAMPAEQYDYYTATEKGGHLTRS